MVGMMGCVVGSVFVLWLGMVVACGGVMLLCSVTVVVVWGGGLGMGASDSRSGSNASAVFLAVALWFVGSNGPWH
jgi:hypothetical protein